MKSLFLLLGLLALLLWVLKLIKDYYDVLFWYYGLLKVLVEKIRKWLQ